MDWMSGKVAEVTVLWMWIVDEPETERRELGVAAREKMSATWAGKRVS